MIQDWQKLVSYYKKAVSVNWLIIDANLSPFFYQNDVVKRWQRIRASLALLGRLRMTHKELSGSRCRYHYLLPPFWYITKRLQMRLL
jgi:hypothetical protein